MRARSGQLFSLPAKARGRLTCRRPVSRRPGGRPVRRPLRAWPPRGREFPMHLAFCGHSPCFPKPLSGAAPFMGAPGGLFLPCAKTRSAYAALAPVFWLAFRGGPMAACFTCCPYALPICGFPLVRYFYILSHPTWRPIAVHVTSPPSSPSSRSRERVRRGGERQGQKLSFRAGFSGSSGRLERVPALKPLDRGFTLKLPGSDPRADQVFTRFPQSALRRVGRCPRVTSAFLPQNPFHFARPACFASRPYLCGTSGGVLFAVGPRPDGSAPGRLATGLVSGRLTDPKSRST